MLLPFGLGFESFPTVRRCSPRSRRFQSVPLATALVTVGFTVGFTVGCGSDSPPADAEPTTSVTPANSTSGPTSGANVSTPSNGAPSNGATSDGAPPATSQTTSGTTPSTSPATGGSSQPTSPFPDASNGSMTTEDDVTSNETSGEDATTFSGVSSEPQTPAGETLSGRYPCTGADPGSYDVAVAKNGQEWTVSRGSQQVYTGSNFEMALTSAYSALDANRTSNQSILVVGDGEIAATSQVRLPSFVTLNVCGTVTVTGTPSGSDRSPFFARGAEHIQIPNLKLAGSPQYGIFLRQTNDIHLGHVELRLTRNAGIGIRVDSGPNAGSSTDFNRNLTIDHVYGTGMGSHVVETYGIDGIRIGAVEGEDVGECGLLLNRSINAEVGSVTCTDCATGTGYAAFRVANSVGKIGNEFPTGNVHVGKVSARRGGRGFFSVSGCGGIIIDEIDIADTGNTSILMQNTYNTVLAAKSGTISGGLVQLTNDTNNTNNGTYPPSKDVTIQNLTLQNGASVRQDWCNEFGSNGCSAENITGGSVSMCSN